MALLTAACAKTNSDFFQTGGIYNGECVLYAVSDSKDKPVYFAGCTDELASAVDKSYAYLVYNENAKAVNIRKTVAVNMEYTSSEADLIACEGSVCEFDLYMDGAQIQLQADKSTFENLENPLEIKYFYNDEVGYLYSASEYRPEFRNYL